MNSNYTFGETASVLCALVLSCLMFLSGGCSPGSSPDQSAAGATIDRSEAQKNSTAPQSGDTDSAARALLEKDIAILQTGDADAAAKALLELVPDAKVIARRYEDVMRVSKSASGKINLAPLKVMSEYYAHPPAELESSRDRGAAILWWVALKLWEMPKGDSRQRLLDRFMVDVGSHVEEGRISPETGLDVAWRAIFRLGIFPDASLDSLVRLLEKFADGPNPEMRKVALDRLLQILQLIEQPTQHEVYEFIKAHSPGEHWPESPERLYRGIGNRFNGFMTRKQYDEFPTFTLRQLHDKLKGMHCNGERCPHTFCRRAIEHIIGAFPDNPTEVTEIVKSLLDGGLYIRQIGSCALVPSSGQGAANGQVVSEHQPLIDVVLAAYEWNVARPEPKRFWGTTVALGNCLRKLHRSEGGDIPVPLAQLQERCAKMLFAAQGNWERLSASNPMDSFGESPLATVAEAWPTFYPQTQEDLKALAREYVSDKGSYGDLPQATRDKVEKALNDLIAMP